MSAAGARRAATRGDDRGFALLIVLWAVVLLALLATQLMAAGRTELQLVLNAEAVRLKFGNHRLDAPALRLVPRSQVPGLSDMATILTHPHHGGHLA